MQICTVYAFISAIELPRIPAYLPKKIDNCKFVSQCHAIIRKKCLGCFMTTFLPSFCYYLSVFLTTEYHLLIEVHESLSRIFSVFMRVSRDTEISLPHFGRHVHTFARTPWFICICAAFGSVTARFLHGIFIFCFICIHLILLLLSS